MRGPGQPTLDQLQVLLAVVEEGSFAGAARRLGRATSAVSYAIDTLESQLAIPLFDRGTTRKPELTQAGLAVLGEARGVIRGVDMLRARVQGLMEGLEPEVTLAVDVMLPTPRLVDALQGFQETFPTVPLRLHVETLGGVTQLVLDRTATLGITGPMLTNTEATEQIGVGEVEMVPVAAPRHPLATAGQLEPGAVRDHIQLVLTDRTALTRGQDFAVFSLKSWRLADMGAKHALLLAGIGWGTMPEPMVREDIAAGRLIRLGVPEWSAVSYRFRLLYRRDTPLGPAARWLIERFVSQMQKPAASG